MARYWLCAGCRYRNERVKRKCVSCGRARPKPRVPKHARTLQSDTYEDYVRVSAEIHGVTDESCCVCRKPKGERKHDRDHDHSTGNPRGLACHRCNRSMPHWMTAHKAQLVADYLKRVEDYYAKNAAEGGSKGRSPVTKPEDKCRQQDEQTAFPKNS